MGARKMSVRPALAGDPLRHAVQLLRGIAACDTIRICRLAASRLIGNQFLLVLLFGGDSSMPKYVIEREMPGVGGLTKDQLTAASQTSCSVLQALGPQIQWVESYVTDDKLYCIYVAPNKQLIEEHAKRGGFPANRISEVKSRIDPTTAEGTGT
jgi:hypothetical protein